MAAPHQLLRVRFRAFGRLFLRNLRATGAAFLLRTSRLPSFRDWERIRGDRDEVMTAWQLYRTFEKLGGAWSAFQFAVDERARELEGMAIAA